MDLGPGLRVLVMRNNENVPGSGRVGGVGHGGGTAIKMSLVLSDLVLVVLTVLWREQASGPLGGLETVACIGGVAFAAWLGCLAAWVHFRW